MVGTELLTRYALDDSHIALAQDVESITASSLTYNVVSCRVKLLEQTTCIQ